jgi:hypothetical protein
MGKVLKPLAIPSIPRRKTAQNPLKKRIEKETD